MKSTWLTMGVFVALACAGLLLADSCGPNVPSGVAVVADSESAQILGGGVGSDVQGVFCNQKWPEKNCNHDWGYVCMGRGHQTTTGTATCGGWSCNFAMAAAPQDIPE